MNLSASASPEGALLQYGAVGAIALLAIYAVIKLFARQVAQHDRDIERADRAEAALADLNALIRTEIVAGLVRATDAIGRVGERLAAEQRREETGRSRHD